MLTVTRLVKFKRVGIVGGGEKTITKGRIHSLCSQIQGILATVNKLLPPYNTITERNKGTYPFFLLTDTGCCIQAVAFIQVVC